MVLGGPEHHRAADASEVRNWTGIPGRFGPKKRLKNKNKKTTSFGRFFFQRGSKSPKTYWGMVKHETRRIVCIIYISKHNVKLHDIHTYRYIYIHNIHNINTYTFRHASNTVELMAQKSCTSWGWSFIFIHLSAGYLKHQTVSRGDPSFI